MRLSSLQNPLVKHLVKIRDNAYFREESQSVLVFGPKLCTEIAQHVQPRRVFLLEGQEDPFGHEETYSITSDVLKKITHLPSPEPIVVEFPLPQPSNLAKKNRILVLDRITDPGNMGTLIRTALAFNWDGLFLTEGCVDPFHDKVVRASRGGLFFLPWTKGTWEELTSLKEERVAFVADMEGTPLPQVKAEKKCLLLLSNEAQGVSKEGAEFGKKISIPMSPNVESLNVAIAGALLMYVLGNGA